jgi:hypothetical protein
MKIRIFQIGGNNPEGFLGFATDTHTLKSLVRLAEANKASGVSLHGTMPHLWESIGGEFTFAAAYAEIDKADKAIADMIMDGMAPDFAMMDMD